MNLLRTTLDNGLKVLIQEHHTAPVASVWAWYRVGSRYEHRGITGASHWVEHMLFKGTGRWPRGEADRTIAREGGNNNGLTWYDFTTYYATLPVQKLYLALDIEADRMKGANFAAGDVEAERPVVINERQGHENSPLFLLGEAVSATAYHVHPYRQATIGYLADLRTLTYEQLHHHYQSYYTPQNALLTIAGDFNAGETKRLVERYFEELPSGPEPPPVHAVEPPQRGERRVVVEGAGQTHYIEVAFHAPPVTHEDFYALTVLNAVLAGGSGFLVGRGSLTNYTSRLYRALVETELAVDVHGSLMLTVDPGLYRLLLTVLPGHTPLEVEQALESEIARLQDAPVSQAELEKAQRQAQALFAYSSESVSHQAFWLGFSEIFADYGWFTRYLERLAAVTAEELQAVAQTYLRAQNRTTGWYLATGATPPAAGATPR